MDSDTWEVGPVARMMAGEDVDGWGFHIHRAGRPPSLTLVFVDEPTAHAHASLMKVIVAQAIHIVAAPRYERPYERGPSTSR
jgi:hypothetical protein